MKRLLVNAGLAAASLALFFALADAPWAEVSTWELDREEPSYSWMTVEHFTRSQPDRQR